MNPLRSRAARVQSRKGLASAPAPLDAVAPLPRPGDYAAFLSYLPASGESEDAIAGIRRAIRARTRAASTFGVGPRYLHSTGQYHKGGPNSPLLFLITGDDKTETEIPGAGYSFSVLKRAQALGDYETLAAHGRRVLRLHVTGEDPAGIDAEADFQLIGIKAEDGQPTESPEGEGVVPYFALAPIGVTADNIEDTVIADGFRTVEEVCTGDTAQTDFCKSQR